MTKATNFTKFTVQEPFIIPEVLAKHSFRRASTTFRLELYYKWITFGDVTFSAH